MAEISASPALQPLLISPRGAPSMPKPGLVEMLANSLELTHSEAKTIGVEMPVRPAAKRSVSSAVVAWVRTVAVLEPSMGKKGDAEYARSAESKNEAARADRA